MTRAPLPAVSPDVLTAALADDAVLLDLASKRYFQLNETGRVIWDGLAAGVGRDALVQQLVETFDVSSADAAAAVDRFVASLHGRSLVRDAPPEGA